MIKACVQMAYLIIENNQRYLEKALSNDKGSSSQTSKQEKKSPCLLIRFEPFDSVTYINIIFFFDQSFKALYHCW